MMNSLVMLATTETFRLFAFCITITPLVLFSLRNGQLRNDCNLLLFIIGLVLVGSSYSVGAWQPSFGNVGLGFLIAIGLLAAGFLGYASFGVVKLLIALLPWFDIESYVLVFVAACAIVTLIGFLKNKRECSLPFLLP